MASLSCTSFRRAGCARLRAMVCGLLFAAIPTAATAGTLFLENDFVRIGANLDLGGSITYLSPAGSTANVINNHDWGRQVQQSYYSGPANYDPYGNQSSYWSPWPWNPIQSGDCFGNRAEVLESHLHGNELYVKTRPMQWALDNVPGEATFETWIRLEGQAAHVRARLVNMRTDTVEQFAARHQELPAVYTVGTLYRLVTYNGLAPFTGGAVTEMPIVPPPWQYWRATENWAALVSDDGWGLGVFHPGSAHFVGGFHGTPNTGGPYDDPTGYISPIHTEVLDSNIVYEYDYDLILGTLGEIRQWVYDHQPDPRPDYIFQADRQHWYSTKGDAGWPIVAAYRATLAGEDPIMLGPECAFRAEDVPTLYVSAAYHLTGATPGTAQAQIFWDVDNAGSFSEQQSVRFDPILDGEFHTYALDLSASEFYGGLISQLRFDPIVRGQPGDYVDVAFISYRPDPPMQFPGDANGDGVVDLLDLGIVGDNWNGTDKEWEEGDFNDDGTVDLLDLGIVGDNWGTVYFTTEGTAPDAVPEPTTAVLLLLGPFTLAALAVRHPLKTLCRPRQIRRSLKQ